jgi:hypothetical protein
MEEPVLADMSTEIEFPLDFCVDFFHWQNHPISVENILTMQSME